MSTKPTARDYLVAEMAHLRDPQSDFPYGHAFRRDGDTTTCRCGFRLTPETEEALMANEFPEATARELNRFVTNEVCAKCGHEIRFSDREDGTCEVRIVLEQAGLGVETTVCGCFCQPAGICAQCESNARWNEAGGYHQLAKECREYCRRGHREQLRAALHPQPEEGR